MENVKVVPSDTLCIVNTPRWIAKLLSTLFKGNKMGCWNKTCGLSNLYIYAGTPVYVFILEEKRDVSNCYSTSLFSPLLLPFESKYNDYGGGEDSGGIAFPLIIQSLKESLVEMPVGDNEHHDIAVTRDDFGEEQFFDAVRENRLFTHDDYRDKNTPITFTMFRKDVVNMVLDGWVVQKYVGDGKGNTGWGNNYVNVTFADIVTSIPPLVDALYKDLLTLSGRFYITAAITNHKNKFVAAGYLHDLNYRYSRLVQVTEVLETMLLENRLEDAVNLLKCFAMGQWIDYFMHDCRKTWIPGGHEGSQSSDTNSHKLLCTTILSVIEEIDKEFDNEDDE